MTTTFPDGYLDSFPPVKNAFAYGSAIFPQSGYAKKQPMVDLIFIVDDAAKWHAANIARNPSHYSSLKFFGSQTVAAVNRWGPKVYFNAFVHLPGLRECKYGVVEERHLIDDMRYWTSLYLAGRMHKPIAFAFSLKEALSSAAEENHLLALRVALLLLPDGAFSLEKLLWQICDFSYRGDIRNGVAENPRKVWNIVEGQGDFLERIYRPLFPQVNVASGPSTLTFEGNKEDMRQTLPVFLRNDNMSEALRQKVFLSSLQQTQKGILSNGPARSVRYAVVKLAKRFKK
eukprot:GEMP01058506.1.p1 GENE.GEMP01058506.1~~GEMP01058506.1.p1  ORF type:complete len:287 (+),score=51.47 GEMP01058506.1:83-943(+)